MNKDILKDNNRLLELRRNLCGARIVILGFAREGIDTLRFLRKLFPEKILGITDRLNLEEFPDKTQKFLYHLFHGREKKKIRERLYLGENYLKALKDYDVIIKSPGIPLKTIKPFLNKGQIVTSQTEIFFDNCPGEIIGITGTKGKSTTASLIYEVLKKGGLKAHLVGNIGEPVLSHLFKAKPDDVFVYELSSHQLSNLKKSPHISVFLNIYPEHLDYYKDFKEYLRAKQNICRYQTKSDLFLYNPENKYVRQTVKISQARKIALNPQKAKIFLEKRGRSDLPPKLLGDFNFLNMAAAIETGRIFGVPDQKIAEAIQKFKPLPHRLELVGEYRGIKFYNDSLATIPEATIAALDALGKDVETIFLGGFDRGLDFKRLAKIILKSRLKNLVFFPTTGKRIWREIGKLNRENRFFHCLFTDPARNYDNKMADLVYNEKSKGKRIFSPKRVSNGAGKMKAAVELAFKHTKKGKICLLSCASPSFGLFKDYRERGDLFKKYIKELERK
ncbi:MAG: UDP-N-acetylmuramoyl-L-alanine--D-glutamate ligase [bacterium]|nr:UDP-N-acetylmuramoyl-L-alanine--D-glutamate ligase [bacterium]